MSKLLNILYFLVLFSATLWVITVISWINGNSTAEPWSVLFSAIISTLLSISTYVKLKKRRTINTDENSSTDLYKISELLDKHFSLNEFKELCFILNVDFENLPGETKSLKAIELVGFLNRRSRIIDLLKAIELKRPNIKIQ